MGYHFKEIEHKWKQYWEDNDVFKPNTQATESPYYILDMFPYPSGAGLHVGHPLGYIATDILAKYKGMKGHKVLHPMGFDAFGLPAEQYAIQTGVHPAESTDENIKRYIEQLKNIGLGYDWESSFRTTDPEYMKWTQWIFLQLFDSYFDSKQQKALPIATAVSYFKQHGSTGFSGFGTLKQEFTAQQWAQFTESEQEDILQFFRLAYRSWSTVNWCPNLGTVLANDEVKDGRSERGGHPVEQKKMQGWTLRISAYSERLLKGLEEVNWPDSTVEQQKNWIGKSVGAHLSFPLKEQQELSIDVFTTRPDTLYGVSYLALAPENEMAEALIAQDLKEKYHDFLTAVGKRTERQRQAETKEMLGFFTGKYALHPITHQEIPIYLADYVLHGYGTGAVMAVPAHDDRDYIFAKSYQLDILPVIEPADGSHDFSQGAYSEKAGTLINSHEFTGNTVAEGRENILSHLKKHELGIPKVMYRLRDAVFSRQRYWGEPIPIYYNEQGIPKAVPTQDLPITLPSIEEYLPTEDGQPPLARAQDFNYKGCPLELNTMPGWAGSSWYYFRYMDPKNHETFASQEAQKEWGQVDFYVGGNEHATGHLLYARFWCKVLHDLGHVSINEPFKRLFNQGMILHEAAYIYREIGTSYYWSSDQIEGKHVQRVPVDISLLLEDGTLDTKRCQAWRPDFHEATFYSSMDGKFHCVKEMEKMSKSKFNVVNPDDLIATYGADALRMYEMFLGPVEQYKPWNTQGISGVYNFLKKFWNFCSAADTWSAWDTSSSKEAEKAVHTLLKKIEEDMESVSLNTTVSAFMICINQLQKIKIRTKDIVQTLAKSIAPFAPFIAEEIWNKTAGEGSVLCATFPVFDAEALKEDSLEYAIAFNGKKRFTLDFPADATKEAIEADVLSHEKTQHYLENSAPKRVIVVPRKMVNIVI